MADGSIEIRKGSIEAVEAVYYVTTGTIAVQDHTSGSPRPDPVVDIYGPAGLMPSYSGLAATNWPAPTKSSSEAVVQYLFDTSSADFVIGQTYTFVFSTYVQPTDASGALGALQKELCAVDVYIMDPSC